MTIDSATMGWLIPLAIGIFCGLGWLVVWVVKLSIELTAMKKDIDALEKEASEQKAHNQKQHEELYESRNQTNVTLERLTTLFENMDKKLDTLLDRRVEPR